MANPEPKPVEEFFVCELHGVVRDACTGACTYRLYHPTFRRDPQIVESRSSLNVLRAALEEIHGIDNGGRCPQIERFGKCDWIEMALPILQRHIGDEANNA